jgi:erythromycin esterase-like protein
MQQRLFRDRRDAGQVLETLEALTEHLSRQRGAPAKIVVWEHNSHLGDARVTESASRGQVNVGQPTRALEPLERTARWTEGEVPETYPFAV